MDVEFQLSSGFLHGVALALSFLMWKFFILGLTVTFEVHLLNCVDEIVVVDDEIPQLLAVTGILKDHGYAVAGFHHADEALAYIKINRPVLVLSDLALADTDGMEFVKRIQLFDESIECVLMSGHCNIEGAVDASLSSVCEYLKKPFRSAELLAVVGRVLNKKSTQNLVIQSQLPEDGTSPVQVDEFVNHLLARYVHKLNNAMLPFVFELDRHLECIQQFSDADQTKLKSFSAEIKSQMSSVKTIRTLIVKK